MNLYNKKTAVMAALVEGKKQRMRTKQEGMGKFSFRVSTSPSSLWALPQMLVPFSYDGNMP
jgi:hypothetical protein